MFLVTKINNLIFENLRGVFNMKKSKIFAILVSLVVLFSLSAVSFASSYERELSYVEKLFDPDFSVDEVVKESEVNQIENSKFSILSKSRVPKYSKARYSVKLKKLWGGQWAGTAKSMARDQYGKPITIDKISAKASLYSVKNGNYEYKTGKKVTEENSSDVFAEVISGIDKTISVARGTHTFKHAGYQDIERTTEDKK